MYLNSMWATRAPFPKLFENTKQLQFISQLQKSVA